MTTCPNPFLVIAPTRGPPRSTHRSPKSPSSIGCQNIISVDKATFTICTNLQRSKAGGIEAAHRSLNQGRAITDSPTLHGREKRRSGRTRRVTSEWRDTLTEPSREPPVIKPLFTV